MPSNEFGNSATFVRSSAAVYIGAGAEAGPTQLEPETMFITQGVPPQPPFRPTPYALFLSQTVQAMAGHIPAFCPPYSVSVLSISDLRIPKSVFCPPSSDLCLLPSALCPPFSVILLSLFDFRIPHLSSALCPPSSDLCLLFSALCPLPPALCLQSSAHYPFPITNNQ